MRRLGLLLIPVLAVVLAACSRAETSARTVAVVMSDDMRYDPATFEFIAGETIRFEVTNEGQVAHELFIGATADHEDHAAEMRESGHSADSHSNPAAVTVDPGGTETLTYTFEEAGKLLAGCHQPGHYEAGMVAPITVHP